MSVGDVVVLAECSGSDVLVEGRERLILDAVDVLGVVEGKGGTFRKG